MSKLKKTIWSIDLDVDNPKTRNGISFGETMSGEPAMQIGGKTFSAGEIDAGGFFQTIKKVTDYLYEIEYSGALEKEYAYKYIEKKYKPKQAGCSSMRVGNWFARNFDWYYSNQAEFVVRTKSIEGRYASIGVACGIDKFTKDFVESKEYADEYRILPFLMKDGINENGVFCNINVVPNDYGNNYGTVPTEEEREKVCTVALVRYILDNFASAKEAIDYIKKYVSVYENSERLKMGYMTHFMIGDETETYILEFVGNEIVVVQNDANIMTNFYLHNVDLLGENFYEYWIITPYDQDEDQDAMKTNHITEHGAGLERFQDMILFKAHNQGEALTTKNNITDLFINDLKYTNTYGIVEYDSNDSYWYTEYTGINGLKVNSLAEDFIPVINIAHEEFLKRDRNNPKTWQTVHTSVYDIKERKIYLHVQEEPNEYSFGLIGSYSKDEMEKIFAKRKIISIADMMEIFDL